MRNRLSKVKLEIEDYVSKTNLTELEVIEKLKEYYFNKRVNENLKLYKKSKKKVSEITRDLKISPRRFYAILEEKNISHIKTKYNMKPKEVIID